MRFECRICVLRLAFHVFIQIRYEHPHQVEKAARRAGDGEEPPPRRHYVLRVVKVIKRIAVRQRV